MYGKRKDLCALLIEFNLHIAFHVFALQFQYTDTQNIPYTHIIYWRIACAIDESMQRNNYILGIKSYAPYAAHTPPSSYHAARKLLSQRLSIVAFMQIPKVISTLTHTQTHTQKRIPIWHFFSFNVHTCYANLKR